MSSWHGEHPHDSNAAPAPDVTHAVMTRLGFELVCPVKARRTRLRQRLVRGSMVTLFLLLAVAAGLHERVSLDDAGQDSTTVRSETARHPQASFLGGLAAPFEELERLLEHREAAEGMGSVREVDPACLCGPTQGGELLPLLEDDSGPFACFPRS